MAIDSICYSFVPFVSLVSLYTSTNSFVHYLFIQTAVATVWHIHVL